MPGCSEILINLSIRSCETGIMYEKQSNTKKCLAITGITLELITENKVTHSRSIKAQAGQDFLKSSSK